MSLAQNIDALHDWLAEHPRPAGVSTSEHLQSRADAGDKDAARILASGLFSAGDDDAPPLEAPAPVPPAVAAREARIATQRGTVSRNMPTPRRPIVQSGESRPWLK